MEVNKLKATFNKYDTLALKGIAIIMMLLHHNFWKAELFEDYIVNFKPFSQEFIVSLAASFKICVSIYAFITGYGLALSIKKLNKEYEMSAYQYSKWTMERLISVLSRFWFIAILSYIGCQLIDQRISKVFFNEGMIYGIVKLFINFMGLSNLYEMPLLNGTWWYMSAAVAFIFLVPIYCRLANRYGHLLILSLSILIPRILGIGYAGGTSVLSFTCALFLGATFSEYAILDRLREMKIYHKNELVNKSLKFILATFILIGAFKAYLVIPYNKLWEINWGIIPVFVIYYCYEFIISISIIRKILAYLGKHSMNIFLVHTFIRYYYLRDLTYSFKHFTLITLFLLISSLVISVILEKIKEIIRYHTWIEQLKKYMSKRLDRLYKEEANTNKMSY